MLALGLVLAGISGCGDRSLILTVNILSFLDPAETSVDYAAPGGLPSITIDVADESVNLLPGLDDATDVLTATVDIAASFDNQTGSATGSLLFYAVPNDSVSPFTAPPIASIPVSLSPATVTNVSATVESAELAAVLVSENARIGIRLTFDTSATPPLQTVQGTETLTQLLATVVTKKKV
jgi:hypothetical protein